MAKYAIATKTGVKPYYCMSKKSVARALKRMKNAKEIKVYQVTSYKIKRVPLKTFQDNAKKRKKR